MRAFVILCTALGIGLLAACASPRAPSGAPNALQLAQIEDRLIMATAESAVVRADVIDSAWPGHWRSPAFVLYRPGSAAYLYSAAAAPAEFVPLPATALPVSLQGKFFGFQGAWRGLRGGVVPVDPSASRLVMAVPVGNWAMPLLEALIHESFHGWQFRKFDSFFDPETPQRLPGGTRLPSDYTARIEAERVGLTRVLKAESRTSLREEALAYLELRLSRMAASDSLVERVERRQERIEGVAEYVGIASYHGVRGADARSVAETLGERISDDVRWGNTEVSPARQLLRRTYLSGAVIAYALEQAGCPRWREGVTADRPLDALLARCLQS